MKPKLSILICTIPSRYPMLKKLHTELYPQLSYEVEVLLDDRSIHQIGYKRNRLLNAAKGDYISYIDDDDHVSPNYINLLIKAIDSGCDCSSLKGIYSVNGNVEGIFEHSTKYKEWKTNNWDPGKQVLPLIKYERYPNHLNMIRADIAKQFKFPEINHGEDHDWSTQLHKSGLLKCEYYIPEILYYYRKVTKK